MRLQPRAAFLFRSIISLALVLALSSIPAISQQRGRARQKSTAQKKDEAGARASRAIALLVETANKARLFDDLLYRARIQALAADALWTYDEQQARTIFRRAWEAATASDKEEREETASEIGALPGSIAKVTEARDEVLRRAAAHDSRLADIFLRELTSEDDGAGVDNDPSARRSAWHELSASGARRLALAYELLDAGETRRAVEIAAPLINEGVSADTMAFILRLRSKAMSEADALYLHLVEHAASDPQTDANSILLLSSFAISQNLLVVVDESGSLQFRSLPLAGGESATQLEITRQALNAFYNLAATVLLRPKPAGSEAITMQDLIARFYATGRLLPYFESTSAQYAMHAPALRALQSELFSEIEANRRDQVSAQFKVSSLTTSAYADPLRSQNEELARAGSATERERIAISIIKTAVRNRFWDRARRAAAEIEDAGRRRAALSFIQVQQIKAISVDYADEKEDDFESIVKFVRDADVPPFAKAWGMAEAAVVASRKHGPQTSQKIAELIDEAENYAAHVEQEKPERVAAYGVVVMTAARFDQPRAWRLLSELVKSANEVEDFTGDETSFDLAADESSTDEASAEFRVEADVFRLDGIFATMAHLDFDKALAEARNLQGQVPQALAAIAGARAVLEKQNPRVRIQKPE